MENRSEMKSFICTMSTAKTFTNLHYRITRDELKTCIEKLKYGKAVGIDRISAEMIKTSVDQLLPVYEKYLTLYLGKVFIHITGKVVFLYPY